MRWTLLVTEAEVGDAHRIALQGRLSAATTGQLASALAGALGAGHRCILLDLNGLDYISSGGILAIEAASARLEAEGGWLRIEGAQPAVRVALDLGRRA